MHQVYASVEVGHSRDSLLGTLGEEMPLVRSRATPARSKGKTAEQLYGCVASSHSLCCPRNSLSRYFGKVRHSAMHMAVPPVQRNMVFCSALRILPIWATLRLSRILLRRRRDPPLRHAIC